MKELFFQLLQVAVGQREALYAVPTPTQWHGLFEMAKMQALVGVCADAIDKLPREQRPPKTITQKWAFMVVKIEQRNKYLNDKLLPICGKLYKDGFDVCLLKGQGVAEYYQNPLHRQSGDLDLWMIPKGMSGRINHGKCREAVVKYAYRYSKCTDLGVHHIDFPVFKDIPIELHFVPAYFNNYITNLRFERWLSKHAERQFDNITTLGVACPTDTFNLVFLLMHIYKHFLFGGIGLRQLMDYYYVVTKWSHDDKLLDAVAMEEFYSSLRRFNMMGFCGAVMWLLHRVFGLERSRMLTEPDSVYGNILLDRILTGGNFGQYLVDIPCSYKPGDGYLTRYYKRVRNSMYMFRHAPAEIIWAPVRIIEIFFRIRIDKLRYKR